MKKVSSGLYDIARNVGKLASQMRDIEVMMSGDPKKILKREYNKKLFKLSNKISRNLRAK